MDAAIKLCAWRLSQGPPRGGEETASLRLGPRLPTIQRSPHGRRRPVLGARMEAHCGPKWEKATCSHGSNLLRQPRRDVEYDVDARARPPRNRSELQTWPAWLSKESLSGHFASPTALLSRLRLAFYVGALTPRLESLVSSRPDRQRPRFRRDRALSRRPLAR